MSLRVRALIAGALFAPIVSGDTLILKSGKRYTGVFTGASATQIRFRIGKSVRTFSRADVSGLEFGHAVANDSAERPAAHQTSNAAQPPAPAPAATPPSPPPSPAPTPAPPPPEAAAPQPAAAPLAPLNDMNRTTPLDDTAQVNTVYTALGGPTGILGLPAGPEHSVPGGRAAVREFANGFIYWTSQGGAHAIYGPILEAWVRTGGERSPLGYPVSDEEDTNQSNNRYQRFEHGSISWSRQDGARIQPAP